jgi:transcriptional regulator with XRE-family HTH domain
MVNLSLLRKKPVGTTDNMSPQGRSRADRVPHYMRQWRKAAGLTIREMADKMNELRGYEVINQPHLSRIETGSREYRQDILEAFAEVVGCTPADLLGRQPTIDADAYYKALRRLNARKK